MDTEKETRPDYCKKTFLTDSPEPSTSAIVCFYGDIKWSKDEAGSNVSFIEVCNCHEKARLHRTYEMSHEEWLNQVRRLMGEVAEYLAFLEDQSNKEISRNESDNHEKGDEK